MWYKTVLAILDASIRDYRRHAETKYEDLPYEYRGGLCRYFNTLLWSVEDKAIGDYIMDRIFHNLGYYDNPFKGHPKFAVTPGDVGGRLKLLQDLRFQLVREIEDRMTKTFLGRMRLRINLMFYGTNH